MNEIVIEWIINICEQSRTHECGNDHSLRYLAEEGKLWTTTSPLSFGVTRVNNKKHSLTIGN